MNLKIGNLPSGKECFIKYKYVEKLDIGNKIMIY